MTEQTKPGNNGRQAADNVTAAARATAQDASRTLTFDTMLVRDGELIIFVTPGSLDGFAEQVTLTASIDYVVGPALPPAVGTGSVRFSIGSNGNGTAALRNSLYDLLPLADFAVLCYSTYVSAFGLGGQAPYLLLDVNFGVGTTVDEQLFFEPVYQDGTYPGDPVPDQGTLTLNTWQTWDAMIGGWHTGGGPPLITLANYIVLHPAARIVNSVGGGGLQIAAGGASPAWDNFIGNVNPLQVGDANSCIIYNFGPTAGPGTCR